MMHPFLWQIKSSPHMVNLCCTRSFLWDFSLDLWSRTIWSWTIRNLQSWTIKGILTDVKYRVLSKFSKFEFFVYFRSSPLRSTIPQRNWLKSFQYEMRALFTESLVHKTLFNTVVYGSNETHIIVHNLKT